MRAKLLTLWGGPLPRWYPQFVERISVNKLVSWELVPIDSLNVFNQIVSESLGSPCHKGSYYSLCDLRPMFGDIFAEKFIGFDFWGWCDLDIVTGDLDGMLGPLMQCYDIISTEFYVINGAMTLIRNDDGCVSLYECGPWEKVLFNRGYLNFDEGGWGSKNPEDGWSDKGFTRVVIDSKKDGLRCHFDDRSWGEGRDMVDGKPSGTCRLDNNKLIELPTEREIILYHFGSKIWPVREREGS